MKFAAEGCNVAINYFASQERAEAVKTRIEKEFRVKAVLIQGVSRFLSSFLFLQSAEMRG